MIPYSKQKTCILQHEGQDFELNNVGVVFIMYILRHNKDYVTVPSMQIYHLLKNKNQSQGSFGR